MQEVTTVVHNPGGGCCLNTKCVFKGCPKLDKVSGSGAFVVSPLSATECSVSIQIDCTNTSKSWIADTVLTEMLAALTCAAQKVLLWAVLTAQMDNVRIEGRAQIEQWHQKIGITTDPAVITGMQQHSQAFLASHAVETLVADPPEHAAPAEQPILAAVQSDSNCRVWTVGVSPSAVPQMGANPAAAGARVLDKVAGDELDKVAGDELWECDHGCGFSNSAVELVEQHERRCNFRSAATSNPENALVKSELNHQLFEAQRQLLCTPRAQRTSLKGLIQQIEARITELKSREQRQPVTQAKNNLAVWL